ncbi:hypothetical protein BH10PAT1_BH10PAT1_0950 [soil metagenome]
MMRKYEKFLFFYSVVFLTIFIISYTVFYPSPINFLTGILIFPIIFYFWVRVTNPEKTTPLNCSIRFIFVLTLLSILGIGAYKYSLNNPKKENNIVIAESSPIQTSIATPIETPSSTPTTADITPFITPKIVVIGKDAIDVYSDPDASSKVVGKLNPNQDYLYTEKQLNWYKIITDDSIYGWVHADLVKEVNL